MESHKQQGEDHGEVIHSENGRQDSLRAKPEGKTQRSGFARLEALPAVGLSERSGAGSRRRGRERRRARRGARSGAQGTARGPGPSLARSLARPGAEAEARLTRTALRRLFILNPYRVGVNSSDFIPAPDNVIVLLVTNRQRAAGDKAGL